MHVANFYLFNSYIPQKFRKIIHDYYGYSSKNSLLKTDSIKDFNDENLNNTKINRYDLKFNYLVNDDIQIGIQNTFGSITNIVGLEQLGGITPLLSIAGGTVVDSKTQKNIQNLNNLFSYSVWQKTDPLTVNLNIILYAKTDPLIDVVVPAYTLMSHCIIDYAIEGKNNDEHLYSFPGISSFEALKIGQAYDEVSNPQGYEGRTKNKSDSFYSKLISLHIDGLVNMKLAMIKNITPTFSKHTAKSNYKSNSSTVATISDEFSGDYPISAELNLQIESIIPADSNMLWEGLLNTVRDKHQGIKNS